jgi:ComF family protein
MWKKIIYAILEILFPAGCYFCKKPGNYLCEDCKTLLEISPVHQPNRSTTFLDDVYAAGDYKNRFIKKMVMCLKYEPFHRALAAPLAGLVGDHFRLAEKNIDRSAIIVAVPLAQKRIRWRGFNQARAIADELGKIWQLPVSDNALIRTRETKIQADLDRKGRRENIKGAFICPDNSSIIDKTVYLIDDVFTTGATMEEGAKILKRHGAAIVIGIAVARTKK